MSTFRLSTIPNPGRCLRRCAISRFPNRKFLQILLQWWRLWRLLSAMLVQIDFQSLFDSIWRMMFDPLTDFDSCWSDVVLLLQQLLRWKRALYTGAVDFGVGLLNVVKVSPLRGRISYLSGRGTCSPPGM